MTTTQISPVAQEIIQQVKAQFENNFAWLSMKIEIVFCGEFTVQFNSKFLKRNIRISYVADLDHYDVTTVDLKNDCKVEKFEGIYCDQLGDFFTK